MQYYSGFLQYIWKKLWSHNENLSLNFENNYMKKNVKLNDANLELVKNNILQNCN